jgi:hypothetical protein
MRILFGCLAVLLGAVSVLLAARYGYKGADTTVDGLISAVVFGAIALCAFIFDAAAVRLWFMRHHLGAVVIGIIAAAALVVTFTNSLGAIAGRADITQAERVRVSSEIAADRAELKRLAREREAITLRPATEEAISAAREAVAAAERVRLAECGNGDPRQRGPNCRAREGEDQAKRDALAALMLDRAAAIRAAELDAAAAAVRNRLAKAAPVQNANPLGAALEALLGAGASVLTAWQQAVVAAVFELCLVGVMVIYELLGHARQPVQQQVGDARSQKALGATNEARMDPPQAIKPLASPARRKAVVSHGSVKSFVRDQVFRAEGERVEMKILMQDYRAWCAQKSVKPLDLNRFLDEIEEVCSRLGIEIEVGDDQRVYCLNVKRADRPSADGERSPLGDGVRPTHDVATWQAPLRPPPRMAPTVRDAPRPACHSR